MIRKKSYDCIFRYLYYSKNNDMGKSQKIIEDLIKNNKLL